MSFLRPLLLAAAVCASAGGAWAQASEEGPPIRAQEERARIAAERAQIEKRFAGEEAQCYRKFGVTDCLQESRKRRRQDLGDLRRQELSLNDADRKRRAADQVRKGEEKQTAEKQEQAAEQRRKTVETQQSRLRAAQRDEEKHQRLEQNEGRQP